MRKPEYKTTEAVLRGIPLPQETDTYKPIGHDELIDLTLASIYNAGFTVQKTEYMMSRGGQVANGRYLLGDVSDGEMQIQIAWQNSFNKQLTLKWAMGAHVFICSNSCISGDMGAFKRKHTGSIQQITPQYIEEYVKTAGDVFREMQKEREIMKNISLSKRVQAEIIGRMYIEEQFIESTQLNIIKRELEKPTYNYGAKDSLWELYQFTTFAMRGIHPALWMDSHLDAHKFFTEAANIIQEKKEIILPFKPVEDPSQLSIDFNIY